MTEIRKRVFTAAEYIKKIESEPVEIGIILGTGLGHLADAIEVSNSIDYRNIPEFPVSTVESHAGKLLFGNVGGKRVVALQGRFHLYEGYTASEIALPIRVMRELGVKTLLISNACGSLNPYIRTGDLMIIDDHINLMGDNPLIGEYDPYFGPRFVDLSEPYSQRIIKMAESIALDLNVKVTKGVYSAMSGPSLETRAEYRMLRIMGADVIGMSTIPECITARQMGIEVFGVSIITDECYPDALKPTSEAEIVHAANTATPKLSKLFTEVIRSL
ncbi:MAG: purine-nucleoside phosphorylase [Candidatus Kapabacteria bacterium]|nr:purine-nucleoside phosphorylase [Ignavibacteriota bacterium]MCW5883371.1 purine-nucleoside phosphorylase [Candidatus Kapabacteria bacterium]